jgi:hypothetical protein
VEDLASSAFKQCNDASKYFLVEAMGHVHHVTRAKKNRQSFACAARSFGADAYR